MKKVAIITICDNNNYGNRLQNYALNEIIKKIGYESVTLWDKKENSIKKKIKLIIKRISPIKNLLQKRSIAFELFTQYNITNFYIDQTKLEEIGDKFDYFIVGSDQIWNYKFGCASDKDFLKFCNYNKTISYAPSFGISVIDDNWKNKLSEGINHIKYLSVREEKGAEIIKQLTNRKAFVALDPTLLMAKNEWKMIEKKPKKMINKKYILTYFLGGITEQLNKEISILSQKENLEIINLNDEKQKDYYICGPSEFLYLFDNAELILTDSFHACVFSMIYNKPFFVFDRNSRGVSSMNSRLDTLLKTFKQEHRKVDSLKDRNDILSYNYNESYEILKRKQEECLAFLRNSLSISDEYKEVTNE